MENFENEEWRRIIGFSKYEVSDMGRIRSSLRRPGSPRILKCYLNDSGYVANKLVNDNGVEKCVLVHRLLMMTFDPIENASEMEVDHINFVRNDNRRSNLRWLTRKDNIRHSYSNGRRDEELKRLTLGVTGENSACAKLTTNDVISIRSMRRSGVSYSELSDMYGISQSTVSGICNGRNWKHTLCISPLIESPQNKKDDIIFRETKESDFTKNYKFGEAHHNSKLNPEKVLKILEMLENGIIVNQIAREFGVDKTTITSIRDGETWKRI